MRGLVRTGLEIGDGCAAMAADADSTGRCSTWSRSCMSRCSSCNMCSSCSRGIRHRRSSGAVAVVLSTPVLIYKEIRLTSLKWQLRSRSCSNSQGQLKQLSMLVKICLPTAISPVLMVRPHVWKSSELLLPDPNFWSVQIMPAVITSWLRSRTRLGHSGQQRTDPCTCYNVHGCMTGLAVMIKLEGMAGRCS